ncbi:hypothetical protein [Bergeriella denitrificans]|uniref:EF hand n=1 Tax=Bergeriella denitrificans TaxID=494 RepID=A0A378UL36_BERDE|nr:hypothetical protein [Bergeriella denitrificans]STZ77403.1 EF hand [Bergeriella denitrificans]
MKTVKYTAAFLILSGLSAPLWACSAMPPESSFIYSNDRNGDGMLNRSEWRESRADEGLAAKFTVGGRKVFRYLDKDRNGAIDRGELAGRIDYIEHPCAAWERAVRQMSDEAAAGQDR